MSRYKLTYYDFTGMAEPIRYMFRVAGVEFEDIRIPMTPDMHPVLPKEMKDELPWGTIPTLEVDGKITLGQSVAIFRFVANRLGFAGRDEFEKATCDELVDAFAEFGGEWRAMVIANDETRRQELEKRMSEDIIPFYMGRFEKVCVGNAGEKKRGNWLVGKGPEPTWADVVIAHYLTLFMGRSKVLTLDEYPAMKELIADVYAFPDQKDGK